MVGQLHTSKSWDRLLEDLAHEFELWGIDDYHLPYRGDSKRKGEVSITFIKDGREYSSTCSKFQSADGPERNLAALHQVVRASRLAEQRGILQLLADLSSGLALPDPTDFHRVLGVSKDATESQIRSAYHAAIRRYHPDTPTTGNRALYDIIREAGVKLGVARE